MNDGAIQRFREPIHDFGRAKRFKSIVDFGKNGMPVSVSNFRINDVNVFQFRLKDIRAKFDAIVRKFIKPFIGRQVFRANMESQIRHVSCSVIGA